MAVQGDGEMKGCEMTMMLEVEDEGGDADWWKVMKKRGGR